MQAVEIIIFGESTHSLGQMYKLIIWTTGHRKIPMLIILV